MAQILSENNQFDENRFQRYFTKMITRMKELEQVKYLPPKFT